MLINTRTKEEVNEYIKEYEKSKEEGSQEVVKVLKIAKFQKNAERLKEAMQTQKIDSKQDK